MIRTTLALMVVALVGQPVAAHSAAAEIEPFVAGFLAAREALVREGKIDVSAMSNAIRAALTEAYRLHRDGESRAALARLRGRQTYRVLLEIPSFEVQAVARLAYGKLGDRGAAEAHGLRAEAMKEILVTTCLAVSGLSPEPIRCRSVLVGHGLRRRRATRTR